jgi:hypothetical protein
VIFLPAEQRTTERIARRFFQRTLNASEYAGLAGSPDDACVEVGSLRGMLYIEMGDPVGATYHAHYYVRRVAEHLMLVNDGFHIHLRRLQGQGFGLRMFCRQVQNARMLGIHRIAAVAGRRRDENGYYNWPRFGFDGILPARLRRILPTDLEKRENHAGFDGIASRPPLVARARRHDPRDLRPGLRQPVTDGSRPLHTRENNFCEWLKKKYCKSNRNVVS